MDDNTSDEVNFVPEQFEPIALTIIESVLKDKVYNDNLVQNWVDEICSRVTKELVDANKPYKYVTSCTVLQKNGAGSHLGYSCHWDASNDNTVVTRWPNERKKDPNARVMCYLTVFAVSC